jgi:transglycosylase-like protein with SLT domain
MKRIWLLMFVAVAALAQTVDALRQQRNSVMKQLATVTGKAPPLATSFFTVPWINDPTTVAGAPCDPMPADELEELIDQSSAREDVDPELIRAVISQESGNRPCAVSAMGAQGLMQLMPATAAEFEVRDPFDPKQNVEAGTKLLKQLLSKYDGDVSLALSAYNAGASRVDREAGVPPIAETMNYVLHILSRM